ncbi:hypothetical protein ACTJJ0_00270 [Chitinophaga sp. 22321]|uniref:Uncharacterized protein n=1 Tax=Chitinophaga hostae TaxID=2831022 RepID=A0ABS5IVX1_9BACT|nr:hypothetical protein [Chitinophaga hostae]MBS0027010.1 hypothetical protein [Chitinophaga hostae]
MSYELQRDPDRIAYLEACKTWIRILKTLREDNASLINRLAAALKESARRSFIEEAEEFQLRMLDREESMVLLRHEIGEQLEWLEKQPSGMSCPHPYIVLQNDVQGMIQEHEKVKLAFLVFVAEEKV